MAMKMYLLPITAIILSIIGTIINVEFGHQRVDGYSLEMIGIFFVATCLMIIGYIHKQIFLFGLVLFLSLVINGLVLAHQENQTIEKAKVITKALGIFNTDEGNYPDILQDLVPRYLADIPLTSMGIRDYDFRYYKKVGDYSLEFNDSMGIPTCILKDNRALLGCSPVGF